MSPICQASECTDQTEIVFGNVYFIESPDSGSVNIKTSIRGYKGQNKIPAAQICIFYSDSQESKLLDLYDKITNLSDCALAPSVLEICKNIDSLKNNGNVDYLHSNLNKR